MTDDDDLATLRDAVADHVAAIEYYNQTLSRRNHEIKAAARRRVLRVRICKATGLTRQHVERICAKGDPR